eukprot:jgi/Mesvir1/10502/Mv14925-RA.1
MQGVHSGVTKEMHFHAGGVCSACVARFPREQTQPGDVDCPICVKEKRPPEHVAKLQPPFFELDATQTALAFVISGWGHGSDEGNESDESGEDYGPEVAPHSPPVASLSPPGAAMSRSPRRPGARKTARRRRGGGGGGGGHAPQTG